MDKSEGTENQMSGLTQQEDSQPTGAVEQPQPNRSVHPMQARRMMWGGPRPHFMGMRHPQQAIHRPPADLSGNHAMPIPFYPYLVPSMVAHPPDIQAEASHLDDSQSTDETGEKAGNGSDLASKPQGIPRGRPRPFRDSSDSVATQEAMAAYYLLWSWLTQLHNTYDLNISLSMKTTSARKKSNEKENSDAGKKKDGDC